MKRSGLYLILIGLFFSFSIQVNAQATIGTDKKPDTTKAAQAIDPQEAQQMRDAVKALGQLFGAGQNQQQISQTQQQTQQQNQQTAEEKQKTMAEVADKALDMTAKGISYIAQNLEKAAPWVWRVMMKQQYANAISYLIVPWGWFILVLVYTAIVRWKLRYPNPQSINVMKNDRDGWIFAFRTVIPIVFGIIFFWWGANRLSDSIQILINPEYYAIKNLLQIILNPGTL